MQIKILYPTFLLMLGCACRLSAQQVYDAHHYGDPGDIYLYNRFSPFFFNDELTKAGEQVVWDLGAQQGLGTHPVSIVEPEEGISQFNFLSVCALGGFPFGDCVDIWDATEQAVQLADSLHLLHFTLTDLQRYQNKVSNLLLENFIGFTVEIGGTPTQAVIVYQVPDTVLVFPMAYDDTWTSSTRLALDLNAAGEDITYSSTQTRHTRIDGWGTLQTPYDTFENVIRLRSDILRLDTIVEQDTDVTVLIADQVEFMWLDTNFSLPIMTANGLILSNDSIIINQVEYIYEEICPDPLWSLSAAADTFYLNAEGTVDILLSILESNADSYAWDFGDGQFGQSTGDILHTYNAAGTYTVLVNGCMKDCLPLNSCMTQTITFVVVDPTTAISPVDDNTHGITLFPNPATDQIHFFVPSDVSYHQYTMTDMRGLMVSRGVVGKGLNTIRSAEIPAGMYTLMLVPAANALTGPAYMRVMIVHE